MPLVTGHHFGAQQPHPKDIQRLSLHVLNAHIHQALETEKSAGRGRSYAVLAGAGLGDYPRLSHPLCQQDLTHHVIELVRACVTEIFALQIDPGSSEHVSEPLGKIERGGAPDVLALIVLELANELVVVFVLIIGLGQLVQRRNENLGHIPPSEDSEVAKLVRKPCLLLGHCR